LAWSIIERHRAKVLRFHGRRFLDFENHERREKRMRERAAARWDDKYTYFFGEISEEELKYRDYY